MAIVAAEVVVAVEVRAVVVVDRVVVAEVAVAAVEAEAVAGADVVAKKMTARVTRKRSSRSTALPPPKKVDDGCLSVPW